MVKAFGRQPPAVDKRDTSVLSQVIHNIDLICDFFISISSSHMSQFWESNNDILRSSIAETEAGAEVEGTLQKTNIYLPVPLSSRRVAIKVANLAFESRALSNQAPNSSSPLVSSNSSKYVLSEVFC